ncbi:hypothetical protein DK846_16650 [Methanospirillum lacunae]|uniref:Uncharacterized protein n=1 Tax=Methanospirillum lacunae TaxID=668570 RepID=A0A2V2MUF9_9EURY|nr:hypothetical protein DK846_16650 [Methanospirillum lacunae]
MVHLIIIKPSGISEWPNLKMKISDAFRSNKGTDTFCKLRRYISTMKKQKVSIIDGLILASMGEPWLPGQILTPETLETQGLDVQKAYDE